MLHLDFAYHLCSMMRKRLHVVLICIPAVHCNVLSLKWNCPCLPQSVAGMAAWPRNNRGNADCRCQLRGTAVQCLMTASKANASPLTLMLVLNH